MIPGTCLAFPAHQGGAGSWWFMKQISSVVLFVLGTLLHQSLALSAEPGSEPLLLTPSSLPSPSAPIDEDRGLVKPAVDAVVSLVKQGQSADGGMSVPPVIEEKKVSDALVAMLHKGRSMGFRFSGFILGKFKGGSMGISGSLGKELVFMPDPQDFRSWKVGVYSVSSLGVGVAAQLSLMGYTVGIIFDMKNIEDYQNGFCAATGLFGNIVDLSASFRIACGVQDFFNLTKALLEKKKQSSPVKTDADGSPSVQVEESDRNVLLDQLLIALGDGRPKVINASVALSAGLPLGVILSYQPHHETQAPKAVSLESLQDLIKDELL